MTTLRYVTVHEAAEELSIRSSHVQQLCRDGRIQGVRRHGKLLWLMPSPVVILGQKPLGHVYVHEATEELGISRQRVAVLCKDGYIQGAYLLGRRWVMPSPVVRLPGRLPGRPAESH